MEFGLENIGVLTTAISAILLFFILSHHRKERNMIVHDNLRKTYERMKYDKHNPVKTQMNLAMQGVQPKVNAFADDLHEYLNDFSHLRHGCEIGLYSINDVEHYFKKEILAIDEENLIDMYNEQCAKGYENNFENVDLLIKEIKDRQKGKRRYSIKRFIRKNVG